MAEPMATAINNGAIPRAVSSDAKLYAEEREHLRFREAWDVLAKSWRFIGRHRQLVMLKVALIVGSLAFYIVMPWPMKILIDTVIDGHKLTGIPAAIIVPLAGTSRSAILVVIALFLSATLILIGSAGEPVVKLGANVGGPGLDQAGSTMNDSNTGDSNWNGLFGYFETKITIDLTQRMNQDVRSAVYERFLRAPLGLYGDQKIGDAVFRAMHDSAAIGNLLYQGIVAPIASFAIFIVTVIILWAQFSNEPLIPIAAALALPLVGIGSGVFGRLFRDQSQRMRERGSDVMAAFEERLAQVQLIKAFGQEARESAAVDAASWRSYSETLWMVVLIGFSIAVVVPLVALMVIAVVYHLMLEVIHGKITLGDVILLLSYAGLLITPMTVIGSTWASLQGAVAGLRRVHSVLEGLAVDSPPTANGAGLVAPIYEVEFRDVALGYGDSTVLRDVSLTLRAGDLTAIAGPSGAGKTTIIYAIPHFIEPHAGSILVNHQPCRNGELRRRVGFVFQQEALFSTSIFENIRYGTPTADNSEVRNAAMAAGAAQFIERMPRGYETMLGRRGARLSVGQKQRIAIARALLRNPELLILDEPTAPLDSDSETSLIETMRRLARDRIVVIVAHRPETLAACGTVNFVNDGTIAASGSHEELLRTCPAYRAYLARTQSEFHS
jgi:ABC-type multidrug transport system fused ATPase/permease subunit